jgi:hypothetical protein
MSRFIGKTRVPFVLAALLGVTGCARPWVQQAAPAEQLSPVQVVEADGRPIYIVLPQDPGAPPPEVIVKHGELNTGWTPEALPATNPFERHRTWVGDYDCTQGNTGFALRIMDVRGRVVRAIFDFVHEASGVEGSYVITGMFDPETRRVHFEPTRWIVQPDHYLMVPMSGEVSTDDTLFAGKIDYSGCGAFTLKPTR